MKKKILIIVGHTDKESFTYRLANAYAQGARSAGHEVQEIKIGEIIFDPILHFGYKQKQELESDLQKSQELIMWCEHLIIFFPTWWGSLPAIVKGFFDRVFLPGFAFKYRPNSVLWDKLLSGRSARVVITMDGPVWYYRFLAGAPGWQIMNRSILGFCGFKPIVPLFIGKVRSLSEKDRLLWISRLNALGMKGE